MIAQDLMIGVDIGGTFTDCVVMGSDGKVVTGKSPTTPDDRSRGFFNAIANAAEAAGIDLETALRRCRLLVHGTTTGTNAIVERRGARVGLLATRGHDDTMFVMKGLGRTSGLSPDQALDFHSTRRPEALVARHLVRPVTERIDVDGDIVVPLDETSVRRAVGDLLGEGIGALAISFMWSVANPLHERRARDIVAEMAPDLFVTCSSDLSRRIGEFERTTTAVMNSYIGPLMVDYVDRIQEGATAQGFAGRVQFAQCAGGAITSDEARESPIRTVHSGPVAGTIAMAGIASQSERPNVIAVDMGGTTFDVSVIHDGRPLQRDISIFERYAMALPMLDIESVGAGGGSVAWIDETGRLTVGPRSAGARPGPACYGFGGEEPTVTDADVVLGLIDPDNYLGGRMKLDRVLAEKAIGRLAEQLDLSVVETAAGISTLVDAKMADLVRRMSLLRGLDPRTFACAAFGGGGPVHAPAVAVQAGISTLMVPLPRAASVLSAFGAATSDVTHVMQRWSVQQLPVPPEDIESVFRQLHDEALTKFTDQGVDVSSVTIERSMRMRFSMQIHDVEVPVRGQSIDETGLARIESDFELIHDQLFGAGSGDKSSGIDITAIQVRAVAHSVKPSVSLGSDTATPPGSRQVYWSELREHVETQIFSHVPTEPIEGPALIELSDTVIVVRPGHRGVLDGHGNFVIDLQVRS